MDRQQVLNDVLSEVFPVPEAFDPSMCYSLGGSVSATVEPLVGHALHRVHSWLWPALSSMLPGESRWMGDLHVEMTDYDLAEGREQSRKSFVATVGDKRCRLSWIGIEDREPYLSVASDVDSYFATAGCVFSHGLGGPAEGTVSGRGTDVRKMFEFLGHCARLMPEDCLTQDAATTLSRPWALSPLMPLLDFEGGLGTSMATELHEMAEQKACRMIADWMAPRALLVADFLEENGFQWPEAYLSTYHEGYGAFALNVGDGRSAFMVHCLPGDGLEDRYLTWFDHAPDGLVGVISTLALPAGEEGIQVIKAFMDGVYPPPSVEHDFTTGSTTFIGGGYDQLANSSIFIMGAAQQAVTFDPECEGVDFERRTRFYDDADGRLAGSPGNR